MSLCGIPYFYSEEFKDIYCSIVDFLCVDKNIKPEYVRFQDNRIHIQSAYTNWTEEDGLINCVLNIILNYDEDQIKRDIFGYEVLVDFYFMINGEIKKDETYRKMFKNLDNIENYNKWIEFKYHITPLLVMFKEYEESEEDYK